MSDFRESSTHTIGRNLRRQIWISVNWRRRFYIERRGYAQGGFQ